MLRCPLPGGIPVLPNFHLSSTSSSGAIVRTYNRLLGTMAHQVDRNAIPGTFTLVDLEHTMASRHLDHGNSDIVLVPQPSDDPDDPLNWSPRRKLLSTICVSA